MNARDKETLPPPPSHTVAVPVKQDLCPLPKVCGASPLTEARGAGGGGSRISVRPQLRGTQEACNCVFAKKRTLTARRKGTISGESHRPLTLILHLPISIAILLQKYALLLEESIICATNLHHDTPPIGIAILLQKYY